MPPFAIGQVASKQMIGEALVRRFQAQTDKFVAAKASIIKDG
jgi:hypothetical protein